VIKAKDAVVWINTDTKEVMVKPFACGRNFRTGGHWIDPIGAAYTEWEEGDDKQRVRHMLETALDLRMQGFALKDVLVAFAEVKEFRALGEHSSVIA
jgi:hypothetical protein